MPETQIPLDETQIKLDQLIQENLDGNPGEKRAARAIPRDERATADLLADDDRMDRLAKAADVDRENIIDAAIRGKNVMFVVVDDNGAPSDGFLALSEVDGEAKSGRKGSSPKTSEAAAST